MQANLLDEGIARYLRLSPRGGGEGSLVIHQDAKLSDAHLSPGQEVSYTLGEGRHAWLQVVSGSVSLNGTALRALKSKGRAKTLSREERESNGPVSAATRARLGEVRRALLRLHKVLLEAERASYERGRGSVGGGGEFLQLVINDPWFAWLRPVSELIVRVDELLEPAREATEEEALAAMGQAAALVRPADNGGEYGRRYREMLQRSPDAVLAHAGLSRLLPRPKALPMGEAEIDENLAESFPASDPPSWTLGSNHAAQGPGESGPAEEGP